MSKFIRCSYTSCSSGRLKKSAAKARYLGHNFPLVALTTLLVLKRTEANCKKRDIVDMNKVSEDILRMNGMKVNEYISKAIFTGPDRDIYRTHLYRTYFGQGLGYVQDKTQDITLWTNTF